MSLLYQLLDEHEKLLKEKGYDELSLNSPDKPGLFMQYLKYNLGYALKESLMDDDQSTFNMKTVGFFNNDRDIVLFNLHYLFDPPKGSLEVTALDIAARNTKVTIPLTSSADLPHSSQALALLENQKQQAVKRMSQYRPVYMNKQDSGLRR